ncbi:MAG: 2-dehydro-3-deoxygalactonokinase [Ferruginibacter sp.]|nr:2-dehydro-3-deoxygalactonokinase [Cytophagales bacterium]
MKEWLLCCDWGTSSFRLRLVDTRSHRTIGEVLSQQGVASTFDAWKAGGDHGEPARSEFFQRQLKQQIDALSIQLSVRLDSVAVVISGMASSSLGMAEVPYATLPFAVDGSQVSIRRFAWREEFPHEITLVSGVRSQQDVMRGEETQLVGLVALLDASDDASGEAIFIFPGTHSKHLRVRNGQLIDFQTFMTGEVFHLMATHSILKTSVDIGDLTQRPDDAVAFKLGVKAAGRSPILNGLFTVRTNQLFNALDKPQNALYLSGLLIGTEIKYFSEIKSNQLVLCSGSNLYDFYRLALEELNLSDCTTTVPPDLIDRAATAGQIKIFRNQTAALP